MADVTELVPLVATYVPVIADEIIEDALKRAANRFCVETGVWREKLESPIVRQGDYVIEIDLPSGSRLNALVKIHIDGDELHLGGSELLMPPAEASVPRTAYADGAEIYLDGYLTGSEVVEVMVSLAPTRTSATVPDKIMDEWADALIEGALAELKRYPIEGGNDLRAAGMHAQNFAVAMSMAKGRAQAGRTHARRVVHYGGI